MTYAQFGTIQATDYNTLLGPSSGSVPSNNFNPVWASGQGAYGYGQTALANVTAGTSVAATTWANLVNRVSNSASHQGTSITSVTAPVTGGTITYLSALPTNITTVGTAPWKAAAQGSTTANTATYGSTWSQALTFTHTVTFSSGDQARYFFNTGGQIKMTVAHPSGTGIDLLFNNLASNTGTVVISSVTSGTTVISGVTYSGITKVGGGGNSPTIDATKGYYGLSISNATVFTQTASTGPASYLSTFIRYIVKTNGAQGSLGDTGSVLTIYTIWDEVPDGLTVSTGSATTCTVQFPSTTYLSNTWSSVTVTGTVTGA